MQRSERLLVFLLRLGGVITLTAFGAMVMPTAWMAATHRGIGLGEFPASPVVDYLTRSASMLYGFHGVLLLLLAGDVRRYRPLVAFTGWANVLGGLMLLGIDLHAGLPVWWVLGEGPPVLGMGLALLWLLRAVPHASR